MQSSEQRTFERIPKEIPLVIETTAGNLKATSVDICGEGAGIILHHKIDIPQDIVVTFGIPDKGKQISLEGHILWSRKLLSRRWRAGVRFVKPSLFVISTLLAQEI
jgi:hypothetical protein